MARKKGVRKVNETKFEDFKVWYFTPQSEREPDEMYLLGFSQKNNISRRTLYDWMEQKEFKDAVDNHLKEIEARANRIRVVLYHKALEGNINAIRLFLEYEKQFGTKLKLEGNVSFTGDDIAKAYLANANKDNVEK